MSPRPPAAIRRASSRSPASRRTAAASAAGSPGGTSSALCPVGEQLPRGRRVGGDERRRRTRAPGTPCSGSRAAPWPTCRRCRARSRARGARPGSCSYSTHGTYSTFGGPRREQARRAGRCRRSGRGSPVRGAPPRGSSRARGAGSACRRRGDVNGSAGCQPGRKTRSSAPTKQTATRSAPDPRARRRTRACASVSATTRSAARNARRSTAASARAGERAGAEAPAVGDERVRERDERVEDDRPPARRAPCGRQVEVPRIADDHGVERRRASPSRSSRGSAQRQRARRRRGPHRPVVRAPSQTGTCCSRTSTPARAQARDHLGVARIARGRTCRSRGRARRALRALRRRAASARLALAHALLVVARDHLADQPEREELDADDDEQHAEHEQRPLADRVPQRS